MKRKELSLNRLVNFNLSERRKLEIIQTDNDKSNNQEKEEVKEYCETLNNKDIELADNQPNDDSGESQIIISSDSLQKEEGDGTDNLAIKTQNLSKDEISNKTTKECQNSNFEPSNEQGCMENLGPPQSHIEESKSINLKDSSKDEEPKIADEPCNSWTIKDESKSLSETSDININDYIQNIEKNLIENSSTYSVI